MNDLSRYRDPALYLLAGIALGTALGYHVLAPSPSSTFIEEIRTNASGYSYINPLLFVRTTKEETPAFAALAEISRTGLTPRGRRGASQARACISASSIAASGRASTRARPIRRRASSRSR